MTRNTKNQMINAKTNSTESHIKNYAKNEDWRITKNVVIISFAFMLHFSAFHGTSNLQSSVNSSAALGTSTLAVIYGSLILSNIFLPATIIRWLGCKWTIAISFLTYIPYMAAQYYPRFYTFIPAALGVGFGGGPLWCAKCTYLSVVAEAVSSLTGGKKKSEVTIVRYFGLFFVFYQMAQVWGNLISSSVLSLADTDTNDTFKSNTSLINNVGEICGANFCPGIDSNTNSNLIPPEPEKIFMLTSIFLICMIIACALVAFGVDSLKRYSKDNKATENSLSGCQLLAVTLRQLSEKYQLLLLPITMFIGAEEAFIAVDFTASFVACGWGISRIGYVMICFGIANAIAAGIAGAIAKIVGRPPIMAAVFILHGGLLIWMHEWTPIQGDYITYCTMAALWGIADGVWLVNVNAFSGILFPGKEIAAYSNFRLWESTGSVIGYIVSSILCTSIKLRFLFGFMFIGVIGYSMIEIIERREKGAVDRNNVELVGKDISYPQSTHI